MIHIKPLISFLLRLGPAEVIAVFGATVLASAFEILGVGLIFGFANLVFDPSGIDRLPGGDWLGRQISAVGPDIAFVIFGAGIVALFLVKSFVGFGAIAIRTRYAGRLTTSFARELMALYARQPYENLLQTHSSDFIKNVLSESAVLGGNVLAPLVGIAAEITFIVLMVGFLVLIDPTATLGIIFFFALGYGAMYALINPLTARAGAQRVAFLRQRSRAAIEFFNGIREIIVSGRGHHFLRRFASADEGFISRQNRLRALPAAPAFGVQFLAVSAAMILILYFHTVGRPTGEIIAALALFAAAGLRMMPALNTIIREILVLRGHWSSFLHLDEEYRRLVSNQIDTEVHGAPLKIASAVALRGVSYRYPGAGAEALSDVTIEVGRGESVGIVGATGAGKSTAVEILLGLLKPQSGCVEIDGRLLAAPDVGRWQRALGYVPQHIYLADDTIARNIAFGIADEEIDRARVEAVGKLACIDDFVRRELPDGYDSRVGERGAGLSGGQIQRIGIARALYADPQLLILDEATSALDTVHEELITRAIRGLAGDVATVVIAHRLSTIRHCDRIYVLENGRVVAQGSFDDLKRSSALFRDLEGGKSPALAHPDTHSQPVAP